MDHDETGSQPLDKEAERDRLAEKFRAGALPSERDFRDLIDAVALEKDLAAFKDDTTQHLKPVTDLAELTEDEHVLSLKKPVALHTRLGNFHPIATDDEEHPLTGVSISSNTQKNKQLEWILVPASEAPFVAEVVASLDDPEARRSGLFEDDGAVMLQATVVCRGPRSAHIRTTAIPRLFGPFFKPPIHAASWGVVVLLLLALLSFLAVLGGPVQNALISLLDLAKEDDDLLQRAVGLTMTFVFLLIAAALVYCLYRFHARHSHLKLSWSETKGLVLTPKARREQTANGEHAHTATLRYQVTMLTPPKGSLGDGPSPAAVLNSARRESLPDD